MKNKIYFDVKSSWVDDFYNFMKPKISPNYNEIVMMNLYSAADAMGEWYLDELNEYKQLYPKLPTSYPISHIPPNTIYYLFYLLNKALLEKMNTLI